MGAMRAFLDIPATGRLKPGRRLAPVRDPVALARVIDQVLTLPVDTRRALGARDRAHIVERFALSSIARSYADLWAQIADTESQRRLLGGLKR